MNRGHFFGSAAAFVGAGSASGQGSLGSSGLTSSPAQPAAAGPRKAWQFFSDADMNFVFLGVLGSTYYGAANVGAVLAIANAITDGDAASAFAAFTAAAARVKAIADAARAGGRRASARDMYLQASAYDFAATYFCDRMGRPESFFPTWKRSREALDAGFALFNRPIVEQIAVPYENTTLPGYFFKVDDSGARRPLLILVNGSDGSVLDMWVTGAAGGVERGYNCLTVDGPGQGAALWLQHLYFRPDWEKVVTPIVDYALGRNDVDPARIAIQGLSQGGYWVPRAVAFEHRIAAAVADPGVFDVAKPWLAALPPPLVSLLKAGDKAQFNTYMSEGPGATFAFRARPFGISDPFDLYTAVEHYTLAGVVDKIQCPVLITDPDDEAFFPGQSEQLYGALPGKKELVRFTAAEGALFHCEPMAMSLRAQRIFDWLDATLGGGSSRS